MAISRGVRLGSYEILSPLGAGGMGEVYQARDERLGRLAAIKVLPQGVSSDPDKLKRFEREARSASALNHPNIVTIYEIGTSDSTSYIAMELVDGQPLRALLTQKALPVRRLLDIGVQVAEGLAKAHDAGIVHRDLKPENVMVTEDGRVKILDFGLAKVAREDGPAGVHTPTVSAETQPGVLMGTVGYMSPEQAMGRPVDYRSDQFSLGTILYEMATGRRAFHRNSAAQTLAAIIDEEPEPIAACNAAVPAPVRWIVERCLAKEPQDRFASTEDLARDLAMVRDRLSEASVPPGVVPAERKRGRRRPWIAGVLAAAALLGLGLTAWHLRETDYFWKSPLAGARFTRFTDWEGSELDAAVSPDGKFVAFISDRDGPFDIWVGQVGSGQFLNLTQGRHSDIANPLLRNVGFSDDGTYVWFRVSSKGGIQHSVLLAPTIGGPQRTFLPSAAGAAWAQDHDRTAYFPPDPGDPILVADRNGGNPRQIAIAPPGIHEHYVTWSPQGRFVYFVRGIPPDQMDVWRVPASGGAAERLTHHNSRVAYPTLLDERTLVYVATREDGSGSGSGLYAMDVERRIPHAVSVGIEEYVSVDASAGGRRLVATVANPIRDLWTVPITDHVVDESGARRFKLPTVRTSAPRYGPGYLVYLASKGAADGLWKLKDGSETELWKGSDGAVLGAPAISPDGSQVCFVARTRQGARLFSMTADGTNARRLSQSLEVRGAPSWSPDGTWIAVAASEEGAYPLVMVPANGGEPVRLLDGKGSVLSNPVWSPDGRYILYSEGTDSAMLRLRAVTPDKRPFPLPEVPVGNAGDRYRFLPDGKHLVVMRGVLWQQDFDLLDLTTGHIRPLTSLGMPALMRSFDVSPDGKEILFDRYREGSDVVLIDLAR